MKASFPKWGRTLFRVTAGGGRTDRSVESEEQKLDETKSFSPLSSKMDRESLKTFTHRSWDRIQPLMSCCAGAVQVALLVAAFVLPHASLTATFSYLSPLYRWVFISLVASLELCSFLLIAHTVLASWFLLTTYRLQGDTLSAFDPVFKKTKTIALSEVSDVWSFRTLGPSRWSKALKGHLLVSGDVIMPVTEQLELWQVVDERCHMAKRGSIPKSLANWYTIRE